MEVDNMVFEEQDERPEQRKKVPAQYPLKNGTRYKLLYLLYFGLLPAVPLCIALLSIGALIRDLDVLGMGQGASIVFKIIGVAAGLCSAALLIYEGFRYGDASAYFTALNSRRFKHVVGRLLQEALSQYHAKSDGGYNETEKEISRQFSLCGEELSKYKKFHQISRAQSKLEAVTYSETLAMLSVFDTEPLDYGKLLIHVKKVQFCIGELLTGSVARAYKGDEGYAFISYSHRNTKTVLGVINRLQEARINVWFDEGITEGEDWMDYLAKKIDNCSHFVMFQTPAYAQSANCNVEIKRALKSKKTIIRIILEESKLADGVEMYLDALQAIDCRDGVEKKMEKIIGLLKPATAPPEETAPPEAAAEPKEETAPAEQKAQAAPKGKGKRKND